MAKNSSLGAYAAIITAVLLWGASFVWSSDLIRMRHLPVFTIVCCRVIVASAVLLTVFAPKGKVQMIKRKDVPLFVLLVALQPFLYFIGENYGLKYVDASFASTMIALIPLFVPFTMKTVSREPVRKEIVVGALASCVGVYIMTKGSGDGAFSLRGFLLLLLAVLSASFYSPVLQKLLRSYGAVTITTWQNIIAIVFYIPCVLLFDVRQYPALQMDLGGMFWFDILSLGVLCSAVAYMLFNYSAARISVAKVTVFSNITPVATLFIAAAIGTEGLSAGKVLGILIAVMGVVFSQSSIIKKKNNAL